MHTNSKKVAYFSMEYAIDQSLCIYSGGLGFLAGSHIRSSYDLKQDLIAIGILYSFGYHDQVRNEQGEMEVQFNRKQYDFLQDTGIIFPITVHGATVQVKVLLLPPEVFGTAPLYLLTTDIPENDHLSRTISYRLYDANIQARIAQFMLLGIGGAILLEQLGIQPDVYHMNEGHALPLLYHLFARFKDLNEVKKRVAFTTHTPEKAGNEEIDLPLLYEMGFFGNLTYQEVEQFSHTIENRLGFTQTALRMAGIANAVSRIHEEVSKQMWATCEGICQIIHITNAQNRKYWMDKELERSLEANDDEALLRRKKEMKQELFMEVERQTGKKFDVNTLTITWARRFAGYKRADLLIRNFDRFIKLITRQDTPVQIIWAGKAYPEDRAANELFNKLIKITQELPNCAVLTGYELRLSALLKRGSDVWLNTPKYMREASGTSGMTAAMNGAINFSIPDGWVPEFAHHNQNAFIIPVNTEGLTPDLQDEQDSDNLFHILEEEILPIYYNRPEKWCEIMKASMRDVLPNFDSDNMARQYYEKLYNWQQ